MIRYLNNIKVVDAGIEDVVRKLNQFYDNDGRTAFVFTADHGMSNRGRSFFVHSLAARLENLKRLLWTIQAITVTVTQTIPKHR